MAKAGRGRSGDRELDAINVILEALSGLEGDSIQRVLDYVFGRLSIPRSARAIGTAPASSSAVGVPPEAPAPSSAAGKKLSIRDLKEEKNPTSSNQMAAIVAYYLSEVEGGQDAIGTADIRKYFKQAGFKLPKSIAQTLPNAAAAGYFDSIGDGLYRLNPVGYNLVVHGLPRGQKASSVKRSRAK